MDSDPYAGWGLKPVTLTDQELFQSYLNTLRLPLSDYTFSQIFTWRNSLRILWKIIRGNLCVFANGCGDLTLLMPPVGDDQADQSLRDAFELMDDYNAAQGSPDSSRVEYASQELLARFSMPGLERSPMGGDYLYDVQKMIELPGGDLASKRQAKNRFQRNYIHRVESYDPAQHLQGCMDLLKQWKNFQDQQHGQEAQLNALKRAKESLACELALQCAPALGLQGLVVYVREGETDSIRGFTLGEPLGAQQSSIVVEKTDLAVKGLAQFIFSEFCRRNWSQRPLVNAGDDWGLESLAWTKQSYRPVQRLEKFILRHRAATAVTVPASTPARDAVAPSPIVIRPARREDIEATEGLEHSCFTTYCLSRRQLQYLQQRSSAVFLVAEQDGAVVGEGIALLRQNRNGYSGRVYSLAVDPARRGQHIGQKLLAAVVDELAARGVQRVYLQVEQGNDRAIRLYERSEFRVIGALPDYYGNGRPGLHMMRELQPANSTLSSEAASATAA